MGVKVGGAAGVIVGVSDGVGVLVGLSDGIGDNVGSGVFVKLAVGDGVLVGSLRSLVGFGVEVDGGGGGGGGNVAVGSAVWVPVGAGNAVTGTVGSGV
jgi:hypothetical protein